MSRLFAARNSNHLFIIVAIYICFYKTASHVQRSKEVKRRIERERERESLVSCLFLSPFFFLILILSLPFFLLSLSPPVSPYSSLSHFFTLLLLPASLSFYLFLSLPHFRSNRLVPSLLLPLFISSYPFAPILLQPYRYVLVFSLLAFRTTSCHWRLTSRRIKTGKDRK